MNTVVKVRCSRPVVHTPGRRQGAGVSSDPEAAPLVLAQGRVKIRNGQVRRVVVPYYNVNGQET